MSKVLVVFRRELRSYFATPLAYVLLDIRWFDVASAMRGQKIYQQPDSGKHPVARRKHTLNLKQRRQEAGKDEFQVPLLDIT